MLCKCIFSLTTSAQFDKLFFSICLIAFDSPASLLKSQHFIKQKATKIVPLHVCVLPAFLPSCCCLRFKAGEREKFSSIRPYSESQPREAGSRRTIVLQSSGPNGKSPKNAIMERSSRTREGIWET